MTPLLIDTKSVDGALLRYRVVALVVSVLLIALFFVGIPLEAGAGLGQVDQYVGMAHGIVFYPLYILLTFDLTRRVRMTPVQLVLTVLAGTIPIASFYAERRTTAFITERQAALTAPAVAVETP